MNAWRKRTGLVAALALTISLVIAGAADAALIITSTEGGLDTFSAATNDVINLGSPLLAGQSNVGGSLYVSDPTGIGLNNGTIYDGAGYGNTEGGRTYCPANGSSITFDLTSPQDIYAVFSVSGGSQARRSQRFRLEFGSGGPFTTVADENQIHFVSNVSNGEMRVMLRDDSGAPIGTNVDQIRVTYFNTGATLPQSMYRELDVFNTYVAPPKPLPNVTSASLALHLNASDINNDLGFTDPGNGNDVDTWADLVGGLTLNHNFPTDGKPTFIAAGSGGIGNEDTVRFEATGAGPATQDDLMFNNAMNFNAQTIYAVVTMEDNGDMLATLLSNQFAGLNIRQTVSASPSYFTGNSADFINSNGVFNINGNPRWDIPGGFGAQHVVKAVRNAPATYDGFRLSDNVVADRRWNGDVAEIIVFDGVLNGNESAWVNKYIIDKYGIPQVIDEPLADTTQVADDPFADGGLRQIGVNFYYAPGGQTGGTLHGIAFDNIDLAGATPPSGPFTLSANLGTVTLDLQFSSDFAIDPAARSQNVNATGPDAATLNDVGGEIFYLGATHHTLASMTFSGLDPTGELYVQVIGGDSGWNGDLQVMANGSLAGNWTTVADSSSNNASLFGFFTRADALGKLQLDFSISGGNYAGIGGIIITQRIPEPGTLVLLGLGGLALVPLVRRRRRK